MTAIMDFGTAQLEVSVQMAIGLGAAQWDAGAWDFDRWATESTGSWVDVTCDVSEVVLTSGASEPDGILTAINGTTGSITLHGDQYNPWIEPWVGQLGPGVPVQVLWRHVGDASFTAAFTGVTDSWPFDRDSGVAAVPILDGTGQLANQQLSAWGSPVGQGEGLSARMNRILDAAAWPTGLRQIPAQALPCISTVLGAAAWDLMKTAADTGVGIVFVSRAGLVTYIPIGQIGGAWVPTVLPWNLTDHHRGNPADVCVVNFTNSQPEVVRNDVTIARAADPAVANDAPVVALAEDVQSMSRFGIKTYDRNDLIHQQDTYSAAVAGAVLMDGAWPALHPQLADLDVKVDGRSADVLLGADIGNVLNVLDSGKTFECVLVGYSVDLTAKGLSGTVVLSDITKWIGSFWDTGQWDIAIWSV